MRLVIGVCCCVLFIPHATAQSLALEKWRTTSGSETEGVFHALDASTDTVTILVPRPVPLARLDEAGRERVRELIAGREAMPQEKDRDPPLPFATTTIGDWSRADEEERAEYCANAIYLLINNGLASENLKGAARNIRTLTHLAGETSKHIEMFLELFRKRPGADTEKDAGEVINEVFMILARDQKWLGRDANGALMADSMAIRGLKMTADDGAFDFIGQLWNTSPKGVQLATIKLAFYDSDDSILAVASAVVMNLAAAQSQPIEMRLISPGFTPDLSKARMYVTGLIEMPD